MSLPLPTYAQDYLPRLRDIQDEAIERLATLIMIDSGTGQMEGINRAIQHLQEWFAELGFSVTLHDSPTFGYNLVARRTGSGTKRILLVGHVDTVYNADATQIAPFYIHDGRAYGPGVIDMKCGLVMCLATLRVLLDDGFDTFGELVVVINNDEEIGSTGSAPLLRDIAQQVDVGFVLESSRSAEIVTRARKGADKYMLEVTGVPAHSGAEPQKGRSAVVELAHKILAIHNINTLFFGVTANVTRISSSEQLNMVPDKASCHISIRAHTQEGLDAAADALKQIAASLNVPDTSTRLIRMPGRKPYQATPELLQLIELACYEGNALGLNIRAEGKGGLSDANLLMEMGVPTLDSLGPVGGGMHNLTREHLYVDSLPLRAALLAGLIRQVCTLSNSTGEKPLP